MKYLAIIYLISLVIIALYDIYHRIKFKKFMKENLPKWSKKDNDTKPQ